MLFVTFLGVNIGYQVRCKKCHSSTAYCYSEERAAGVWNRHCEPPNTPLTLEEIKQMAGEPYWYVGLQDNSGPPSWNILRADIAKAPQDYDYGKTWLAYRQKPKEEICEQNKN